MYKQMMMKNFFRAGTEDQLSALSQADPRYCQAFSSCVYCEDHFVAFAPGVHVETLEAVQEGKLVPQVKMEAAGLLHCQCMASKGQQYPCGCT